MGRRRSDCHPSRQENHEVNVKGLLTNEIDDLVEPDGSSPILQKTLDKLVKKKSRIHPSATVPPSKPHVCFLCTKSFQSPRALRCHLVRQHSENPIVKSDPTFADTVNSMLNLKTSGTRWKEAIALQLQSGLDQHTETHVPVDLHVCETCGSTYKCAGKLEKHTIAKECQQVIDLINCRSIKCNHCHGCFKNRKSLTEHLLKCHRKITAYNCRSCGKYFPNNAFLDHHRRLSRLCDTSIITTNSVTEEQDNLENQEFDTQQLPVENPNWVFENAEAYQPSEKLENNITDSPVDLHVCETCGSTYKCAGKLEKHTIAKECQRVIDLINCKSIKCNHCHGCFKNRKSLTEHLLKCHRKITAYNCKSCGKYFPNNAFLDHHRRLSRLCKDDTSIMTTNSVTEGQDYLKNQEFDTQQLPVEKHNNWVFENAEAYQPSEKLEDNITDSMTTMVSNVKVVPVPVPGVPEDFCIPSSSSKYVNKSIASWVRNITSDPLAVFDCSIPNVIPTTVLKMEPDTF